MKKLLGILTLLLVFSACGGRTSDINDEGFPFVFGEPLSGELVISVFDTGFVAPFLQDVAELFMAIHEDVTVIIESFSAAPEFRAVQQEDGSEVFILDAGDQAQQQRDYVNQINTDLMSGRGPDILALDVLPFMRYASAGLLTDLRPFMYYDPNFNISDYRVNILDAITTDAGMFKFPISFMLDYLTIDSTLFSPNQLSAFEETYVFTLEELISMASFGDDYRWFSVSASELFFQMFGLYLGHFIDMENNRANFTDGVFVDILNRIVELDREGHLAAGMTHTLDFAGLDGTRRYYYKVKNVGILFNEFNRDDPQRFARPPISGIEDDDIVIGVLGNRHGQVPFSLGLGGMGTSFGINANSNNQLLAWEFIRFMSNEALFESFRTLGGFPVHLGAFENAARSQAAREGMMFVHPAMARDIELTEAQQARFDAYFKAANALANSLNTFFIADAFIFGLVLEETAEFFNGNRTALEVSETLQSRITIFLTE